MADLVRSMQDRVPEHDILPFVQDLGEDEINKIVSKKGKRELSAISVAACEGYMGICKLLLDRTICNPDVGTPSALHYAAHNGNLELVYLLVEKKANVNAIDPVGQTPLFFARSTPIMEILINHKADLMRQNSIGQTALHTIGFNGFAESLDHLVKIAPKELLDLQDDAGRTPLHCSEHHAILAEDPKALVSLINQGANPMLRTKKGLSCKTSTIKSAIEYNKSQLERSPSNTVGALALTAPDSPSLARKMLEHEKAAKIQSVARGRRDRKRVKTKRARMEQERAEREMALNAEMEAATQKIQAAFRGKQGRKKVKKEKERQALKKQIEAEGGDIAEVERASQKIQASFRGNQGRKTVAQKRKDMNLPTQSYSSTYHPPTNEPFFFSFDLSRHFDDDKLGFTFIDAKAQFRHNMASVPPDLAPEGLIVRRIEGGLLAKYNQYCSNPDHVVREQDRIVSVNGETETSAMQELLQRKKSDPYDSKHVEAVTKFSIKIERWPTQFEIKLDRSGELGKLGFVFDPKCSKTHVRILSVDGGAKATSSTVNEMVGGKKVGTEAALSYSAEAYRPSTVVMEHNQRCARAGLHWRCMQRNMLVSACNGVMHDAKEISEIFRDKAGVSILNLTLHRGAAQGKRDIEALMFQAPKKLNMDLSPIKITSPKSPKPTRKSAAPPSSQRTTRLLKPDNTHPAGETPEVLSLIQLVSPKQQKARDLELVKQIPETDVARFRKYWESELRVRVVLQKPTPDTRYGISFFDGSAAWIETNKNLQVDPPNHLVIKSVAWGGLLEAYNNSNNCDNNCDNERRPRRVEVADRICAVNGIDESFDEMRDALRDSDVVELDVIKPAPIFSFFVKKINGDIGVELQLMEQSKSRGEMKISKVKGPAQRVCEVLVNHFGRYDLVIEPAMRVVGVNNISGVDATLLDAEIAKAREGSWIKLTIRRAALLKLAKMKLKKQLLGMKFAGTMANLPKSPSNVGPPKMGEFPESDFSSSRSGYSGSPDQQGREPIP